MVVTDQLIALAKRAGACGAGIRSVRPGAPIARVRSDYLAWFERRFPFVSAQAAAILVKDHPEIIRGRPGLEFFGYGSGYGYGYGDGYGDGSGYGSGYGYGTG